MANQKAEIRPLENILANPSDKSKLMNLIKEAVDSKTRISSEMDHLKTLKDTAVEELGLKPKRFNELVKTAYDQSFAERVQELNELEFALTALFGDEASDGE